MSFCVDVNVLLYASDQRSPLHGRAVAFLRACTNGPEMFCLAWITVLGYLRMATHPSIFERPLTHAEAVRNVEALMASPMCRMIAEEEGFWDHYIAVTRDVPTRGNLVPDAHLVALLRQNGVVRLYTHDRDFRKFSGLDVLEPAS